MASVLQHLSDKPAHRFSQDNYIWDPNSTVKVDGLMFPPKVNFLFNFEAGLRHSEEEKIFAAGMAGIWDLSVH